MTSQQTVNLFKTIGHISSLISQARSCDVGAVIRNFEDDSFERVVHNLVDHPGSSDAGKVRPLSKELVMQE